MSSRYMARRSVAADSMRSAHVVRLMRGEREQLRALTRHLLQDVRADTYGPAPTRRGGAARGTCRGDRAVRCRRFPEAARRRHAPRGAARLGVPQRAQQTRREVSRLLAGEVEGGQRSGRPSCELSVQVARGRRQSAGTPVARGAGGLPHLISLKSVGGHFASLVCSGATGDAFESSPMCFCLGVADVAARSGGTGLGSVRHGLRESKRRGGRPRHTCAMISISDWPRAVAFVAPCTTSGRVSYHVRHVTEHCCTYQTEWV